MVPFLTHAGVFSFVSGLFGQSSVAQENVSADNSQTMDLLSPAVHTDPNPAKGGGDITVVGDMALLPDSGPSGTLADVEDAKPKSDHISLYVVRPGDSLSQIADMFSVTPDTIRWANDMKKGAALQTGQTLVILPISGVQHTVVKGETLASVAKKYGGDADEIIEFNSLVSGTLAVGDVVIIPDGEIAAPAPVVSTTKKVATISGKTGTKSSANGYYMRPVSGGIKTQGIHGYNAIDIGIPVGSNIMASAGGRVIVARQDGWNGGYGGYVVIQHANGSQTLYAHTSSIIVSVGQSVVQGQIIGYTGNTGKSTGSHLHFEIRGGPVNPF
jgi:murein DD-endopeptidase MepM/ murein hydrolase activator NlpD